MIKIFCDRCNKEGDDNISLNITSLNHHKLFYICEDCYNQLLNWINEGNVIQQKYQNNADIIDIKIQEETDTKYEQNVYCPCGCFTSDKKNVNNQAKSLIRRLFKKI